MHLGTLILRHKPLHRSERTHNERGMGLTTVLAWVQRPDGRGQRQRLRFLADSGAVYTVLPENSWKRLRLRPTRAAEFVLADGSVISRGIAEARFTITGQTATSPVVCGEGDDGPLLGAVTLETLGLMLNPLSRDVLPMKLILGRHTP